MRGIVQDSHSSADVLRPAQSRPEIADNEVLLRVHAAGLDRGTWHLRTGTPYLMRAIGFGFRRPNNRVAGVGESSQSMAGRSKTAPSDNYQQTVVAPSCMTIDWVAAAVIAVEIVSQGVTFHQ